MHRPEAGLFIFRNQLGGVIDRSYEAEDAIKNESSDAKRQAILSQYISDCYPTFIKAIVNFYRLKQQAEGMQTTEDMIIGETKTDLLHESEDILRVYKCFNTISNSLSYPDRYEASLKILTGFTIPVLFNQISHYVPLVPDKRMPKGILETQINENNICEKFDVSEDLVWGRNSC